LDREVIDNKSVLTTNLSSVLNDIGTERLAVLEQSYPELGNLQVMKIFPFLKSTDTISITRLGNKITIPPFWAAFELEIPAQVDKKKFISEMNEYKQLFEYAHENFTAELTSTNDPEFPIQQSMNGNGTYPNAGININQAWEIETGKPFIKVGIHDSGIDSLHEDLDVLYGGTYSYQDPNYTWGNDLFGHGTACAGIIGAKRNNGYGIAGIAGGDTIGSPGVSLIDFRWNWLGTSPASYVCASVVDAARYVGSYWEYPGNYYGDGDPDYFNNAPGFGIHVGNHSFMIIGDYPEDIVDPNISTIAEPNCYLCREAYLFSYKSGVVNVVARGNGKAGPAPFDSTYIDLIPQSFPDDWIISVGASGSEGTTMLNGVNQSANENQNDFWSLYGGNMDIIAPGSDEIVFTTDNLTPNSSGYPFKGFNITSAAAPHATGVAALLLSHFNKDCYSAKNLSVEDVEYILQKSATDLNTTGYDELTGWGRLNAGAALQMIENPTKQIVHPDSLINFSIVAIDTISLKYNKAFVGDGWGPISYHWPLEQNNNYRVERVLVENTYSFANYITPTTQILDAWARPSACTSIELYEDTGVYYAGPMGITPYLIFDNFDFNPFDSIVEIDTVLNTAKVQGYYYHFIDRYFPDQSYLIINPGFPTNYWLPVQPTPYTAHLAFSMYIEDPSLTEWYDHSDEDCYRPNIPYDTNFHLSQNEVDDIDLKFTLFPNPGKNIVTVSSSQSNPLETVTIMDNSGSIVVQKNCTNNQEEIIVSNLASGIYFVTCVGVKSSKTIKFIKL